MADHDLLYSHPFVPLLSHSNSLDEGGAEVGEAGDLDLTEGGLDSDGTLALAELDGGDVHGLQRRQGQLGDAWWGGGVRGIRHDATDYRHQQRLYSMVKEAGQDITRKMQRARYSYNEGEVI